MSAKAKSLRTIQRELQRVTKTLHDLPGRRQMTDGEREAEQYGAMTALMWALGQDTVPPHRLAEIGQ